MTESKKTATRVTAAQVNEKVNALADRFDGIEDALGGIASMLSEQNAAKIISDAARQVEAAQAPKPRKRSVGERDGDVIVRNLHGNQVRVRIGKETDPYRINLQPRGQKGDSVAIPASLRSDMNYKNNLGVAFEEISDEMADALRGQKRNRRLDDAETIKHRERTVTTDEQATVRRMEDTTPEDRLSRVGPHYLDVTGSNNPSNDVDVNSLKSGVDVEADADYAAFLAWRKSQNQARAGGGADFSDARVSGRAGRDVIADSLNVQGGDELSREAQTMARYVKKLESGGRAGASDYGVIPKGELTKPVVVERATVSVQPNRHSPKNRG
jgi:hypothetical protein